MDDPALALSAHDGNDAPGQVMPAEEVRLELLPQGLDWQIFNCPGLRVGAVVVECAERAAGAVENCIDQRRDRLRLAVIEIEGFDAVSLQCGDIFRLSRGGENAPAVSLQGAGAIRADA